MAVDKNNKSPSKSIYIKDFYAKHRDTSILISVVFQLLAAIIIGVSLILLDVATPDDSMLWIIVGIAFLANLGVNLILATTVLEPVHAITRALSHTAGEPSDFPPPNPNTKRYQKDGMKQILELIYSFEANEPINESMPNANEITGRLLDNALSHSKSSLVIMNPKHEITYSSASAPVRMNTNDEYVLDIEFYNDTTLDEWLKKCEKKSITAETIWTRVHTDPDSSRDKKIYDIAASYSRNSNAEVTLMFIDRTNTYQVDEDDLNFIAFAAHELRGPITVIRGYIDILSDELNSVMDSEQKIFLKRLEVSANRLSSHITNILNVSRYDHKHYRVDLKEKRISNIYNSIADDMSMRANAQRRVLNVDISKDLPTVAADESSICEVLSNLIDNAIKYSNENGIIKVNAKVAGDFVEVSVQDHGIGMPDSVIKNLFHKFYRSHRSRESVSGSGIGLYMSKAIVESHGGTIAVRSSEDTGSTFTFSLPIYKTVADKLKSNKSNTANNENIINDDEKNYISNHNMYRG